jgi:hypothetical protein
VKHYHRHRPHRALGLEAPGPPADLGATVPLALLAAGGALLLVAALTSRTRSSHVARDRSGQAPG